MNSNLYPRLWRSFRLKALLIASVSLALIITVLFAISNQWLKRERGFAEQQRADILLNQLASSLRFGLAVHSTDFIRPVLENVFVSPEVRAVAVYDRAGRHIATEPETSDES